MYATLQVYLPLQCNLELLRQLEASAARNHTPPLSLIPHNKGMLGHPPCSFFLPSQVWSRLTTVSEAAGRLATGVNCPCPL